MNREITKCDMKRNKKQDFGTILVMNFSIYLTPAGMIN